MSRTTAESNVKSIKEELKHIGIATSLLSWVNSRGVQNVEWINIIIRQLWPSVEGYVKETLLEKVAPFVRSLFSLLGNFKFTHVELGDVPPKIHGLKIYDENERTSEQIMIDMKIEFASKCNISVSVNETLHVEAGIRDIYIKAIMRIEVEPFINKLPLVGAVAVSFVDDPEIDFDFTQLANILEIPGIDGLFRKAVSKGIQQAMVHPQKHVVQLVPDIDISYLKFPLPEGILRVHVIKSKNLMNKDMDLPGMRNKSDPYVVVEVGKGFHYKTCVVKESLNAEWNESFDVIIQDIWHSRINVHLYDDDTFTEDDSLGTASIAVRSIFDRGVVEEWIELHEAQKGSVLMKFEWFGLSSVYSDLPSAIENNQVSNENTNSSLVSVYVDQACHLPKKDEEYKVQLKISFQEEKEVFKTKFVDSKTAVWNERFLCPIQNPLVEQMKFEIVSEGWKENNVALLDFSLSDLMKIEGMCIDKEFHATHPDSTTVLKMRICLRVFKRKEKQGLSLDESEIKKKRQEKYNDLKKKYSTEAGKPTSAPTEK